MALAGANEGQKTYSGSRGWVFGGAIRKKPTKIGAI